MARKQFRVLYREFLFRLVDREVLAFSEGDTSKLLGRFAAILILISIPFLFMAGAVGDSRLPHEQVLTSAWLTEHSLIATTMLIVGLFTVLSWDSAYPDRRDVLVLTPLPVGASTIFFAKITSLAAALSLTVVLFNAAPGLLLPFSLAPHTDTILDLLFSLDFYRPLIAYWVTVLAAGAFVVCCVLIVQGIAAQLPRRLFLRVSSLLQMTAFCVFLAGYFLQPSLASPGALTAPANQHLLTWLPSYWFLGLFQELNGSANGDARPVLVALAARAWIACSCVIPAAGALFLLSYFRTLRKIVEQPDIVSGSRRFTRLPRFGNAINTAVTQFSIRSLLRSRQHRVLLSFYAGIGFGIVIPFMKTPVAQMASRASATQPWPQVTVGLLASSFVMMCFWILGIRVVFAIPLELRANWIFRLIQLRGPAQYLAASRRAAYVLAAAPLWALSATLFLFLWPLRPAIEHLAVLVLLSVIILELCLRGFHKIPFTCSYLPGKSNLHITFVLCLMLGLNAVYWSAQFERRALSDGTKYALLIAVLCVAAGIAWWRRAEANSERPELRFEEETPPAITSLGLHRDGILPG